MRVRVRVRVRVRANRARVGPVEELLLAAAQHTRLAKNGSQNDLYEMLRKLSGA